MISIQLTLESAVEEEATGTESCIFFD